MADYQKQIEELKAAANEKEVVSPAVKDTYDEYLRRSWKTPDDDSRKEHADVNPNLALDLTKQDTIPTQATCNELNEAIKQLKADNELLNNKLSLAESTGNDRIHVLNSKLDDKTKECEKLQALLQDTSDRCTNTRTELDNQKSANVLMAKDIKAYRDESKEKD